MDYFLDSNMQKLLITTLLLTAWAGAPIWCHVIQLNLIEKSPLVESDIVLKWLNVLYYCLFVIVLGYSFISFFSLLRWAGLLFSSPIFFATYLIYKGNVYRDSPPSKVKKTSIVITFIINIVILFCLALLILQMLT